MVKLLSLFKGLNTSTLYYPGCMLKNVLEKEKDNYKKIFDKLGIDFVMLPNDEVCCGSPVLNAGYKKEAKELAKKNYELFKSYGIKKIITPCPGCYNIFAHEYSKLLREWDIEVEYAVTSILRELRNKKGQFSNSKEVVSFHDPCHSGRYSGIYDEPREIISILGGELKEMTNNKENAICCGAGGGLRANYPELAKKIAKKRMSEKPIDANVVLTPCGLCYSNLKTADSSAMEFSEWVLGRLI